MHPAEMLLTKHVTNGMKPLSLFRSNPDPGESTQQHFTKKIIAQYFNLTINLHPDNIQWGRKTLIKLFHSTFGVIHVPSTASDLTASLIETFNLLTQVTPTVAQQAYRNTIFQQIDEHWKETTFYCSTNLSFNFSGLSAFQKEQILPYKALKTTESYQFIPFSYQKQTYSVDILRHNHRKMFLSIYILLYLEYVFSVAQTPKNRMEILSIIFTESQYLDTSIADLTNTDPILIALEKSLQPSPIDENHLQEFFTSRVSNTQLSTLMSSLTSQHQYNIRACIPALQLALQDYPLNHLMTDQLTEFELGTSLLYIGHRHTVPANLAGLIGTLVDCSSDYPSIQSINKTIEQLARNQEISAETLSFFEDSIHRIAQISCSVEDKRQFIETYHAALFPWHTRYIESLSNMSETRRQSLQTLTVENSFTTLLTANFTAAQKNIASATFNRIALRILRNNQNLSYKDYVAMVSEQIAKELSQPTESEYLSTRLPLMWGLKYARYELLEFFNQEDSAGLTSLKIRFENRTNPSPLPETSRDSDDEASEKSDDKRSLLTDFKIFTQSALQEIRPQGQQNSVKKIIDSNTFIACAGAIFAIILAATGVFPPIGGSMALCLFVAAIAGAVAALGLTKIICLFRNKSLPQLTRFTHSNQPSSVTPDLSDMPANSYVNLKILSHAERPSPVGKTLAQPFVQAASSSKNPHITPHFSRAKTIATEVNSDEEDLCEDDRFTF